MKNKNGELRNVEKIQNGTTHWIILIKASVLYYKHITIVIDAASVVSK